MRRSLAFVAFLACALPAAAHAHARLLASSPAADAVTAPIAGIDLRFSERLIPKLSTATLTRLPATAVPISVKMSGDAKSLVLGSAHPLATGSYRVDYHVTSADTHRVGGTLKFSVR